MFGWPDSEGNSLRAAAVLAGRFDGPVYLLVGDLARGRRLLADLAVHEAGAARVIAVTKRSLKAVMVAATARLTLFTHGLFGNPRPAANRLVVNLWHGHGPKRTDNKQFEAKVHSDLLVTNTGTWGCQTAEAFGLPELALAVIGNPRQDAMLEPPDPAALARLGLSSKRPYILWMPTFRGVSETMAVNWRDSDALSAARSLDALRSAFADGGIDLRVKIHPLDRDMLEALGEWRVTDADLVAAGVPLYSLIGGATGLISDYSSVWVEYLSLDRPLLLFCPDIDDYRNGRGLKTPSMTDIAAGLIETEAAGVRRFLAAVAGGRDWHPQARRKVANALDLAPPGRCAGRLIAAIRDAAETKGVDLRWVPDEMKAR